MKYRVYGTLSVEIVTIVEAVDAEEAKRIAQDADHDVEQLNQGKSENGWTFNDGFSIEVDEVQEAK